MFRRFLARLGIARRRREAKADTLDAYLLGLEPDWRKASASVVSRARGGASAEQLTSLAQRRWADTFDPETLWPLIDGALQGVGGEDRQRLASMARQWVGAYAEPLIDRRLGDQLANALDALPVDAPGADVAAAVGEVLDRAPGALGTVLQPMLHKLAVVSDLVQARAQKAGFDPDQARDERGKWTDEGGGRVVFHSTTAEAARDIAAHGVRETALQQRDSGFFGPGFYASERPGTLYGRSLVVLHLKPDAKVLDVGPLIPTEPPSWHGEFLASLKRRVYAHRPEYPAEKWTALAEQLTPGSKTFDATYYRQEVGAYARSEGYDAVAFAKGSEFVVLHPGAVARAVHVGGVAGAQRYANRHLVRARKDLGDDVPDERYFIETAEDRGDDNGVPVCDVCRTISGISKQGQGLRVREVLAQAEALLDLQDEGELIDAVEKVPFPTYEDVAGISRRELMQLGYGLPGFHPKCRCEAVLAE